MDIQEYMRSIKAGGPGSGCQGPNCGRPAGHGGRHIPEGGKKSFVEQRHDEKLKKKAFNKARRELNKRVKDWRPEGGTMNREEKRMLKRSGQLIDVKQKGLVLNTDVTRVTETKVERVAIKNEKTGKSRFYKVEVEVVKPVGGPAIPKMGKQRGRNMPEGPPSKTHSLYGKFKEVMSFNEGNRQFRAFEAESGRAPGHGASLFLNKETEGNKSRVSIQEVRREEHAQIAETRTFRFDSGKVAKDYLRQRYGLKDVKWRG